MTLPSDGQIGSDWINIRRDQDTGIESVHAHFQGHAYDPHDHDEMLVGVTHQGMQRFSCNRSTYTSTPGRSMLIEPGEHLQRQINRSVQSPDDGQYSAKIDFVGV